MFKKEEEKAKVGRPKLADSEDKKHLLLIAIALIVVAITIAITGFTVLTSTNSVSSSKLKGNVIDTNKIKGAADSCYNKNYLKYRDKTTCPSGTENTNSRYCKKVTTYTNTNHYQYKSSVPSNCNKNSCKAHKDNFSNTDYYYNCKCTKTELVNKVTVTEYYCTYGEYDPHIKSCYIEHCNTPKTTIPDSGGDKVNTPSKSSSGGSRTPATTCQKNQWKQSGSSWYYYGSTCNKYVTGWQKLSYNGKTNWYYFNSSGKMLTGWQKLDYNGKTNWYYFASSGAMKTGWLKDNNKWYYLDSSGAMVTDWQYITYNGKKYWFYFNQSGAMLTGWQKLAYKGKTSWYYFNESGVAGSLATGWKWLKWKNTSSWYYFIESGSDQGRMVTGWQKLKYNNATNWYYFNDDGSMVSNKCIAINGNGFCFNKDGIYPGKCSVSISDANGTSAKAKLTCDADVTITNSSVDNEGKVAFSNTKVVVKQGEHSASVTGDISNLDKNKIYNLTLKLSNGQEIKTPFTAYDLNYIKSLKEGTCPVAPNAVGVSNGTGTYATDKIKMTIAASDMSDIYIVQNSYNANRELEYAKAGKYTKEKIGAWNNDLVNPVDGLFTKEGTHYAKEINIGDYYYTAVYAGSKKCYVNYYVKDGTTLNNTTRTYTISNHNIVTSKGIIKGTNDIEMTSSDAAVFAINEKHNDKSYKATSQNAKNGSEKAEDKTTTITFKDSKNNLSGAFKFKLVDRYWETTYLLNPLTGRTTDSLGKVDKVTKVNNTANSDGAKVYGVELTTAKEGDAVYAMDSGYVKDLGNEESNKNSWGKWIYVESNVNGYRYVQAYAHLKTIYVNKGDRIHKGQIIGTVGKTAKKGKPLSKPTLFVGFTRLVGNEYKPLLLNNFVGRNLSYAIITNDNYSTFENWIDDKDLCKWTLSGDTCNGSTLPEPKPSETKPAETKPSSTDDEKIVPTDDIDPVEPNKCKISSSSRKIGDINCDDKVDTVDLWYVYRHWFYSLVAEEKYKKYVITDKTTLEFADVTADGKVNSADYYRLILYTMKQTNSLCNKTRCYKR